MYCLQIDRKQLVALLLDEGAAYHLQALVQTQSPSWKPNTGCMWACWGEEPTQGNTLPHLLILEDEEPHSFFAWAATFLPKFRPLTAFIRVIPWTVFEAAFRKQVTQSREIGPVVAGITMCEAMIGATGRGVLDNLPVTAFESTFSATLGRALFCGYGPRLMERASLGWKVARTLTEQPMRRLSHESLEEVWAVVAGLAADEGAAVPEARGLRAIWRGCREIQQTGRLSPQMWERISDKRLSREMYNDIMRESREQRVEFFEYAVRTLMGDASDEVPTSFLVGYLASLISDGSIEHAQLVLPLQPILPTAMMWYGVSAGLMPQNRVLSDYGNLGFRLIREMAKAQPLVAPPMCDVAVDELEVLFRGDPRSRGFRQNYASLLRVEVAPTISTAVRWPLRAGGENQMTLFGGDERPLGGDSGRLQEIIDLLKSGLSVAESMLASNAPSSPQPASVRRPKRRR